MSNNTKTQRCSSVHRFHDLVSLTLSDTKTVYLSREHAAQLGGVLASCAEDIQCCTYQNSGWEADGYSEDES